MIYTRHLGFISSLCLVMCEHLCAKELSTLIAIAIAEAIAVAINATCPCNEGYRWITDWQW